MDTGELVGYVLAAYFAVYALAVIAVFAVAGTMLLLVSMLALWVELTEVGDTDA